MPSPPFDVLKVDCATMEEMSDLNASGHFEANLSLVFAHERSPRAVRTARVARLREGRLDSSSLATLRASVLDSPQVAEVERPGCSYVHGLRLVARIITVPSDTCLIGESWELCERQISS